MLVGVIESTDRVQHMMWRFMDPKHPMYDAALAARFGDSIERVYRRADEFVGEVVEHIDPGTAVSDRLRPRISLVAKGGEPEHVAGAGGIHGAAGQQPGEKKLDDLFGGGEFWENVDWAHTRAYAMGIGQIYFNLRGREGMASSAPAPKRTGSRPNWPLGSSNCGIPTTGWRS